MKTIKLKLNQKSIQEAIREIEKYKKSLLDKNKIFVKRLSEIGIPVIDNRISSAKGDADKSYNTYIEVNSSGENSQAVLKAEGKNLLIIEFGAGIHYNGPAGSSPHPKGKELGYTIGSYGKGLGKNDYWYYISDSGEKMKSYGTQAAMPLYHASVEMRQKMVEIAKEVFR